MTSYSPRIVVGCDGSPDAERAFDWANRLAHVTEGTLVLVAAWRWPTFQQVPIIGPSWDPRRTARSRLSRLAAESDLPIDRIRLHVDNGDPVSVLLAHAEDADLLVLGSHGRGAIGRALLGSVSSRCASSATCPVVIVRETSPDVVRRGVVVGVDESAPAQEALHWAMDQAELLEEELTVITCAPPVPTVPHGYFIDLPGMTTAMLADRQAWLEDLVAKAEADRGRPVPRKKLRVVEGSPPGVLVDRSATARLTVVGRRGTGGFQRLLVGSVASALMHHAQGTVAITPTVTTTG